MRFHAFRDFHVPWGGFCVFTFSRAQTYFRSQIPFLRPNDSNGLRPRFSSPNGSPGEPTKAERASLGEVYARAQARAALGAFLHHSTRYSQDPRARPEAAEQPDDHLIPIALQVADASSVNEEKAAKLLSQIAGRVKNPAQFARSAGVWSYAEVAHGAMDICSLLSAIALISKTAIRIINSSPGTCSMPSFITVPSPVTTQTIQQELATFGLQVEITLLASISCAVCSCSLPDADNPGIIFVDESKDSLCDDTAVFLHFDRSVPTDDIALMALLYRLGFEKAVILSRHWHLSGFLEIHFTESQGRIQSDTQPPRQNKPWPERQPQRPSTALWVWTGTYELPACCLDCGVTGHDLTAFFTASTDKLWPSIEDLDLPDFVAASLHTRLIDSTIDRLIIYTDGTSSAASKHISPLLNDEIGIPDAWCFLVLGEHYGSGGESSVFLLGWMAHQVRVDPQSDHFIGANKIGSSIAEREALTWALLWRIGINLNTPTVFRTDSQLTLQQATGEIGAADCDMSFQLLRGSYQLLEAALPQGDLLLEHVFGHAGDPFNEFCDLIAKAEAQRSFYLPWIYFPLPNWKQLVPYLWMLFDGRAGVPQFQGTGFAVPAPDLPPCHLDNSAPVTTVAQSTLKFALSVATANVLSMSRGADGHGGKLQYLRSQFTSFGFNFLGLQETRTEEGTSVCKGVLRLSSGHQKGTGGVELWCNLHQPILPTMPSDHSLQHVNTLLLLTVIRNDCLYILSIHIWTYGSWLLMHHTVAFPSGLAKHGGARLRTF